MKKLSYEELESKVDFLKHDLKINNSFLKKLFDTIPNPMFYKDKDGVYQHCNDAFSKTILGIPKEEIIGKSLYELPHVIPKELADIYYEKDKELFLEAKEQFYEGKVKCSDGKIRDYHFYKSSFVADGEIIGLVGIMLDVSDYKKALLELDEKNQKLASLSITDHLTGISNRRHFQEVFEQKLSLLARHNHKFSFALIDIDYFKDYNDCYGHHEGDIALQKLAQVLRQTLNRPNDFVFRMGGEEFAALFETQNSEDAFDIMEKFRQNVEDMKLKACNTTVCEYMTVSIGLGNIKQVGKDVFSSKIYNEVDKLLYQSKDNGRNQITVRDIII